jgi:hypothetical protein
MFLFLMLHLAACALQPTTLPPDAPVTSPPADDMPTNEPLPDPLFPQPGDEQLTRGPAFLDEASLLIRESYPPQIALSIRGSLPTPCHELRVAVSAPGPDNKIVVDVYSLVDPGTLCTQVLEPFEEQVELGSFPSGHYFVWANGELAGEFDS